MGTMELENLLLVKTLSGHYDCVVNGGKITYKRKICLKWMFLQEQMKVFL